MDIYYTKPIFIKIVIYMKVAVNLSVKFFFRNGRKQLFNLSKNFENVSHELLLMELKKKVLSFLTNIFRSIQSVYFDKNRNLLVNNLIFFIPIYFGIILKIF